MMTSKLEAEIQEQLSQLPLEQQRQVLEFVRALVMARVRGVSGETLLRFAGTISPKDLVIMAQTIDEGCEQVNQDDW